MAQKLKHMIEEDELAPPKMDSSSKQPEPGKIVIALGRDPKNLKLKDDLDIIMLKNPAYLERYNRNRSLLLMDVIRELVNKNKKYL